MNEFTDMSNLDIVLDTINFYGEDLSRRAVYRKGNSSPDLCQFQTADGRRCAIGRLLPHIDFIGEALNNGSAYSLSSDLKAHDFEVEGDWIKARQSFLSALQGLHDSSTYWTEGGLSEEGKRQALARFDHFRGDLSKEEFETLEKALTE